MSNYNEIVESEAVQDLGSGVTTDALVNFMDLFYDRVVERVEGPGANQYLEEDIQKFETMSIDQITDEMLDELADSWAYIAFAAVHLIRAIQEAKP
ncbi:MAG: hypothetical protein EB168_05515 [Euryarchaeota archaeon]|nr:hypothetical protein [Euryarchaeota archaeon]